jgi:hypothetical protein
VLVETHAGEKDDFIESSESKGSITLAVSSNNKF